MKILVSLSLIILIAVSSNSGEEPLSIEQMVIDGDIRDATYLYKEKGEENGVSPWNIDK